MKRMSSQQPSWVVLTLILSCFSESRFSVSGCARAVDRLSLNVPSQDHHQFSSPIHTLSYYAYFMYSLVVGWLTFRDSEHIMLHLKSPKSGKFGQQEMAFWFATTMFS